MFISTVKNDKNSFWGRCHSLQNVTALGCWELEQWNTISDALVFVVGPLECFIPCWIMW